MNKNIKIALNKFTTVPNTLRQIPAANVAAKSCDCDLARLYHHYYLDSYGKYPPNPDPAHFEYIQFLSNCNDFRMAGDGIGASTTARRSISTALGQAFCRWFLYEHLNITYFAHMDKILNKALHPGFGGLQIKRVKSGDAPDYFCAENINQIYLSEAKGRYKSINFTSKEFQTWRNQFSRIEVSDSMGRPQRIKGFITGARYATENNPSVYSKIYAEDPDSPGDEPIGEEYSSILAKHVIAEHYSNVFEKLDQPLIAAALTTNTTIPEQLQFQATIWQFRLDNLKGMRFVGGYWPYSNGTLPFSFDGEKIVSSPPDLLRLDQGRGTFFGVEESIFHQVTLISRKGYDQSIDIPILEDIAPFYSAISLLRDGSIVGPAEFFFPVDVVTI